MQALGYLLPMGNENTPFDLVAIGGTYYTTASGNTGISLDGGATVFTHLGRQMPVTGAWAETEEPGGLTEACASAVARVVAEAESLAAFEADLIEQAATRVAAQAAAEQARRAAYLAWQSSPEGQAHQARSLARLQALVRSLLGWRNF